MSAVTINLLSATLAVLAAVFWGRSTAVPVPSIASTEEAIAAGTGISMYEMNNNSYQLALALKKQSTLSKWGAGFAALAALVQAASLFVAR